MRKYLLLLVCLSLFVAEAAAQWQKAVVEVTGKEIIEGATTAVARETGAHAAADAVLTSTTRAMMPILTLSPVLAVDAYVASLPRVNVPLMAENISVKTAPITTGNAPAAGTTLATKPAMYKFQTYSPGGFTGITMVPLQTAPVQPVRTDFKPSLVKRIQRHFAQKQALKRQQQEALLEAAKQDLPKLLTDQTITVSTAGLLDRLPDVQPVDPPTMSIIMDKSKLAEAVEISNPNIPLLPYIQEPGYTYRGMAVTPSDITRFFLSGKGIERRLTESSNRLNMSMAAGNRGATVYFATHKVINMTAVPQHAQFWGAKFLSPKKPILIIARIKGNFGKGQIINYDNDILPDKIDSMVALLEQDGHPRWFDIRATEEGMFQITPYEIIYKQ